MQSLATRREVIKLYVHIMRKCKKLSGGERRYYEDFSRNVSFNLHI